MLLHKGNVNYKMHSSFSKLWTTECYKSIFLPGKLTTTNDKDNCFSMQLGYRLCMVASSRIQDVCFFPFKTHQLDVSESQS